MSSIFKILRFKNFFDFQFFRFSISSIFNSFDYQSSQIFQTFWTKHIMYSNSPPKCKCLLIECSIIIQRLFNAVLVLLESLAHNFESFCYCTLCTIMSFFKIGQNSNNGTKSYLHMYVQIPKNLTRLRLILYEQWSFSYRRSEGANQRIYSILVLKSPLFLNFRAKNHPGAVSPTHSHTFSYSIHPYKTYKTNERLGEIAPG